MVSSEYEGFVNMRIELPRNIGLAFASIFFVTLITLNDLRLSTFVFLAVACSLVDLLGLLYFAGETINFSSFLCIIITVGLSIDYSLHVAHAFRIAEGETSTERASLALANIGPAVLNGGFTSILAMLIMFLADSRPYQIMALVWKLMGNSA